MYKIINYVLKINIQEKWKIIVMYKIINYLLKIKIQEKWKIIVI